jgi:hypothetical protein
VKLSVHVSESESADKPWRTVAYLTALGLSPGLLLFTVDLFRLGSFARSVSMLFGLAVLGVSLVWAFVALIQSLRRSSEGQGSFRALALGVWTAGLVLVSHQIYLQTVVTCSDLQPHGQAIVDALEAHRARTGRFPQSLDDAGVYGAWSYRVTEDGYVLRVGDYGRDSLELSYSREHGWYCDT